VDYLAILEGHSGFIEHFYNAAAEPFETILRKIQFNEEPFVPRYPPGDYDGYEYQAKYNEAHDCLSVLGNCSLGLLEKALHDYLRAFVEREGGPGPRKPKESWFDRHCRFLEENTPFCWTNSPVSRDQIEQINLSRNDILHDPMIDRTQPPQSEEHFRKYPVSRFAEEWQIEAMSGEEDKPQFPLTLDITREKLTGAIADVWQFCKFVEAQRTKS
jgi:hypothetical protein